MKYSLVFALIAVAGAQPLPLARRLLPSSENRLTIRVDTNLVLVPVTVTDARGRVVPNLDRRDFVLEEEKQRQEILSVSHESAPVSVGIVVDLSGSMEPKLAAVQTAIAALLDRLEPGDEQFLVTFADRPSLRVPFTSSASSIRSALTFQAAWGSTALFDAVALGLEEMRGAQNARRTLFVISDGGDNHSHFSERQLRRLVEERDVQIHAIGIQGHGASMEDLRGMLVLEDLARMTGGQHHMIDDAGELTAMTAQMGLALHDRYLLGYRPAPPGGAGAFRRIDVKIARSKDSPRLYVHARRGYRMP